MSQGFKKGSNWRTNSPVYLFLRLIQQFQVATRSTSPDMKAVFHIWLYGRFIEMQRNLRRKKLHRTNQGSNFLGGSFSNRDNVRVPIQFRRESQPQHLKRWFFLKNRPMHFHINSISSTRLVKSVFPALKSNSHFLPESTALTRHYCEGFPPKIIRSCLLLRKEEKAKIWPETPQDLSLWRRPACQTLSKALDISSTIVQVAPDQLKALSILSDRTARRFMVDWEDLKPYCK